MNESIAPLWAALEEEKKKFLDELNGWSAARRAQKPAKGWNALQVMEHVMIAETGTLAYMKKKTQSGWQVLEPTGEEQIKASREVNQWLRSGKSYEAPSVLPEPTGEFDYAQAVMKWNALRSEMKVFFESLTPEYYDRLLFRQPFAGLLNLYQTLEFMTYHLEHHIPQLHRIKAALPHE